MKINSWQICEGLLKIVLFLNLGGDVLDRTLKKAAVLQRLSYTSEFFNTYK